MSYCGWLLLTLLSIALMAWLCVHFAFFPPFAAGALKRSHSQLPDCQPYRQFGPGRRFPFCTGWLSLESHCLQPILPHASLRDRRTLFMLPHTPNDALQRTRPSRCGCNSRLPRAGSLSLVVRPLDIADPEWERYLPSMIARQEIRQMPFEEKLRLLEAVWAELSLEPDRIEVPPWHKDILDERDQAVQAGRDQILEWEEAKKEIERTIR